MVEPIFSRDIVPAAVPASVRAWPDRVVDHGSIERLVLEYRHLCRRGARKFWRTGLERADLEQVAAIGLIKAAGRYDGRNATPFEAYAWAMVVGELMHHVRDYERPVRMPRSMRALERRCARAHEALLGTLGREPSDAELARELGILETTLRDLRRIRAAGVTIALDALEARVARVAPDVAAVDPIDRVLVFEAFRQLTILERRIIVGVYLLGLSQLELAEHLNVTPKSVSRARQRALRRMGRAWAS